MKHRPRREAGFTLVELLLAVTILGAIVVPLGGLLAGFFRNTVDSGRRVAASTDIQVAENYFSQDVASVGSRGTAPALPTSLWTTPFTGAPSTCGSSIGGARVLLMATDNYAGVAVGSFTSKSAPTTDYVAYVVLGSQAPYELHRVTCTASSSFDVTVVRDLAS